MIVMGDRMNLGFDSTSSLPNFNKSSGLAIIDVPRENSYMSIEVDENTGLSFEKSTNTIKGIKNITRKTGPQITGYLVELAEASPELAALYLKHYFNAEQNAEVKEILDKQIELYKLKLKDQEQADE